MNYKATGILTKNRIYNCVTFSNDVSNNVPVFEIEDFDEISFKTDLGGDVYYTFAVLFCQLIKTANPYNSDQIVYSVSTDFLKSI